MLLHVLIFVPYSSPKFENNLFTESLVSIPSEPRSTKMFDSATGHFKLNILSDITYNSVFVLNSFRIRDLNRGIDYAFTVNDSEISILFHDRIAHGKAEIEIKPDWENISIVAIAEFTSFNKTFISQSGSSLIDYRTLFGGILSKLI